MEGYDSGMEKFATIRERAARRRGGAGALAKLLPKPLSAAALRRQAVKDGMRALRLAGAMKVAEGLTTMEEVLRSTPRLDLTT